jgi:hypothetical protein
LMLPPLPDLDAQLRMTSNAALWALYNNQQLSWTTAAPSKPWPDSIGYSLLYAELVELFPAIDPEPTPVIQSFIPFNPLQINPLPGSASFNALFLDLFGPTDAESLRALESAREESRKMCAEAMLLLFPEVRTRAVETKKGLSAASAELKRVPAVPTKPAPDRAATEANASFPAETSSSPGLPHHQRTVPPLPPLPAPSVAPPTPSLPPAPPRPAPRLLDARSTVIQVKPLVFTPVSQVQGDLAYIDGLDVHALAVERVIAWLKSKSVAVPDNWAGLASWEAGTDGSAQQAWFESDDTRTIIRFDEPCGEVHGRSWRVEFTLLRTIERLYVGARVSAMVQAGVYQDVTPTVPRWVRAIATHFTLKIDGRPSSTRATDVSSRRELSSMLQLLRDPHRSCAAVVAITHSARSKEADAAHRLASRVGGSAHVFTVHAALAGALTAEIGHAGEVPAGGARLYARGFDQDVAEMRCPVLPAALWQSPHGIELAVRACAGETVAIRDPETDLPSFAHLRQLILRHRRSQEREQFSGQSNQNASEIQRLLDHQTNLERELDETWELAREYEREKLKADDALVKAQSLLLMRDAQIDALTSRLAEMENAAGMTAPPESWGDIDARVQAEFAGRLVVTPSAWRAARSSVYEDFGFVMDVLSLLGNDYLEMMISGDDDARVRFAAREKALRVEVSSVGLATSHRRLAGQYRTTWNGQAYVLDRHVSGSSSRNRQRGFRVYFAWDEARQMIVVGSLPEHLDNSQS